MEEGYDSLIDGIVEELYNKNGLRIFKDQFHTYYFDNGNICRRFIPYKVNGDKTDGKGILKYFDIEDFRQSIDSDNIDEIIDIIHKSHLEDIDAVWKKIRYIEQLEIPDKKYLNKNNS